MTAFEPLWKSGQLAAITASARLTTHVRILTLRTIWNRRRPATRAPRRLAQPRCRATAAKDDSPFRAVFDDTVAAAIAVRQSLVDRRWSNLSRLFDQSRAVHAGPARAVSRQRGSRMPKDGLGDTGKETFEAVNFLKKANPSQYKPENGRRIRQQISAARCSRSPN